jgi:FKBP-type peptidyl-prolyl cis-trans isomerase SlyD
MTIDKNTVVSLTYQLTVDGDAVEQVAADNPFTFLFGSGNMIVGFEAALKGLESGANFDFVVKSDDAYGPRMDDSMVQLPRADFNVEGEGAEDLLQIGNRIRLQDDQGRELIGIIAEIGDEMVTVDLNHPMAGKDLHFKGEIMELRDATQEEIDHGHVHGPGGHDH